MELLCIFAALAVLFLFCAFLTLKCNLHAALAPLSALGIAVAWLTARAWQTCAARHCAAVGGVCGQRRVGAGAPQRPAPGLPPPGYTGGGAVLGMALAFAVYFFIRQPLATKYDELSLWLPP